MGKRVSFPLVEEVTSMDKKRKRHSIQFRFELALGAAQDRHTLNELSSQHGSLQVARRYHGYSLVREGL